MITPPPAAIAILTALAAALLAPGGKAQQADVATHRQPVLVELFTSQGCSSCPPADRLAARLARDPALVVISRPVTYWDRLGWKDTLAREANTDLQRAYATRKLAGRNGVYTPQVVVDGRRGTVGSNEAVIRQMIGQEGTADAAIAVRRLDSGSLAVGLAGTTRGEAELSLVALRRHVTVAIGAGENGSRTVDYTNVVLDESPLARWSGGKQGLRVPATQLQVRGADAHALVLRAGASGPVLAARMVG